MASEISESIPVPADILQTSNRQYPSLNYPAREPAVQLLGEMPDTGYQDTQWLVERNGQFLQLSEVLYRVLERVNGAHSPADVAEAVTATSDWEISEEQVRQLLTTKLEPLGLVTTGRQIARPSIPGENGRQTSPSSSTTPGPSPLALSMRTRVIGPSVIDPPSRLLQGLFAPPILVPLLAIVSLAHWWLYWKHGISAAIASLIASPLLSLALVGLMVLAGIVHELGHASALRYSGGRARGMGVGLYLVYPAFYTDVTDSYRLGRWARVRTDLGGFYFHLLFASAVIGVAAATGQDFLFLVPVLITFDIIWQCTPFVRFDGYWALADVTGIPDFFSQMGAFVRSMLPWSRARQGALPPLKPWVRAVFAAYILITVPVLAQTAFVTVTQLPFTLTRTWVSIQSRVDAGSAAWAQGDVGSLLLATIEGLLLVLPVAAIGYWFVTLTVNLAQVLARRLTSSSLASDDERA